MTTQELDKALNEIKVLIENEVDSLNISSVQLKLNSLTSMMGLSAETLKWAKQDYLYKQGKIIDQSKSENLGASILKLRIESELWEEGGRLLYAERLNAAIVHCQDGLRTIISLYKTEMQNSL